MINIIKSFVLHKVSLTVNLVVHEDLAEGNEQ